MDKINQLLKIENVLSHDNSGINVCLVANSHEGLRLAENILYITVDKKTVLYLSGGSLKALYEKLAKEEKLIPGAVGLVDERFGPKFHENSNEKMIQDTQFLRYLHARDIAFYHILQNKPRIETAQDYDKKFRELNSVFPKSVGLMGIGPDGHTSSIIPNRPDFHDPLFDADRKYLMVSEFDDPNSHYKERIGMTFLALSMLDYIIILAFGENKKEMFEKMFSDGSEEEIPARFFKRPDIAKKTLLITDQSV